MQKSKEGFLEKEEKCCRVCLPHIENKKTQNEETAKTNKNQQETEIKKRENLYTKKNKNPKRAKAKKQ